MIRATQKRVSIKNVQARRAPSHSRPSSGLLGIFLFGLPQENSKFLFALSQRFPVAFWAGLRPSVPSPRRAGMVVGLATDRDFADLPALIPLLRLKG